MVARVKLLQDTPDQPQARLNRGSVRSKTKRGGRKLGPHARTKRKKATFTGPDGDKPARGRPVGSANKTTRIVREAILLAAEQVGENLRGRHGLVGYLRRIARREPKAFTALLGRVLPMQVNVEGSIDHNHEHQHYTSVAEIRKALRDRGITVDEIYEKPMKVIEHRKEELTLPQKKKSAVERAMVNV